MNSSRTTNIQLEKLAKRYGIPLVTICNKDMLSQFFPYKGAYIINMEDSQEGAGTHWVGLWLDVENKKKVACYFDSFGIQPPLDVIEFIERYGAKIVHISQKQCQNINGGYCGQYTINFFIHMMNPKIRSIKRKYQLLLNQFHDANIRP
jgi:hypothetical protein